MQFWWRTQLSVYDALLAGRILMYGSIISKKPAGGKYWEYLLVHTDNICVFLHEARDVMIELEQMFKLKVAGIGRDPTTCLGITTIGKKLKVPGSNRTRV
jgi:hypothetical protein